MTSCTSNTVCRIAFGKKLYEDGGSERARLEELLDETESIFVSFFISDYFPYMGWADKITGLAARLEKNIKEFDVFYQQIIDEHLDPKRSKPAEEDILDVLLQMHKDRSFKVQLTFDHIKAILMIQTHSSVLPTVDTFHAVVSFISTVLFDESLGFLYLKLLAVCLGPGLISSFVLICAIDQLHIPKTLNILGPGTHCT
ncbi:hypothetical protein Tsubulata_047548 [Turnera subulata]|uniref:Cytochrome P450 n=1 Tax=Turnera subulata TaxID=218843 RepID=A0A9Q0FK92_9ROSI|nr:hypothetical protein Tsubulata_047548 [Turnera subulata]